MPKISNSLCEVQLVPTDPQGAQPTAASESFHPPVQTEAQPQPQPGLAESADVTPESQKHPAPKETPEKRSMPPPKGGDKSGKGGTDKSGKGGKCGKGGKTGKGGKAVKGGESGKPRPKAKSTSTGGKAPTEKSATARATKLVNEYEAAKRQASTNARNHRPHYPKSRAPAVTAFRSVFGVWDWRHMQSCRL